MKKGVFFILFLVSFVGFGQCPTGTITLSSQAEVDAFATTYPGCTNPRGLIISGANIVDLQPLSVITQIGPFGQSDFEIKNNPLLVDLNGLENLIDSGNLLIDNNPLLTNILALSNLGSTSSVIIKNNPSLLSLNGLQGLTYLGDFTLQIENNDSLIDLSGLQNIYTIYDFIIIGNDNFTNFFGLTSLENLYILQVKDNAILENLDGLNLLSANEIGGLELQDNPSLNDITALTNVIISEYNPLIISGNPQLSECSIASICNRIANNQSNITIENNGVGCNTQIEVEANCATCPTQAIILSTQADIDNFAATYPGCKNFLFDIKVEGADITNLQGLAQIESSDAYLRIVNNPQLQSLAGLENLTATFQILTINNNPLLLNLQGLNSFTGGSIYLLDNDGLLSLDGLDSYTNGKTTFVDFNDSLEDISALNVISNFNQYSEVRLTNNPNVTECAIDAICAVINASGTVTVNNNGAGCENFSDVYEVCVGCPYGLITLTSQAEVDAFGINFPTCTEANLIISGSDIVDLTPLQNITKTKIVVQNNPLLTTLEGFNNVVDCNEILIRNNPLLTDVSALGNINSVYRVTVDQNNSLQEITGWNSLTIANFGIEITQNEQLQSIEGLHNITYSDGLIIRENSSLENLNGLEGLTSTINIDIQENTSLENISALSNLQTDLNGLLISLNPNLRNLDGLEGIQNIIYELYINDNDLLENLNGLSNISNSGSGSDLTLQLQFNDLLNDISGLEFISPNSFYSVQVQYNPSLSNCSILSFCLPLQAGNTNLSFGNNGLGCNSSAEVLANCNTTLNTIYGKIAYDFNNDNCDINDYPAGNLIVEATNPANQSTSTVTNSEGEYELKVPEGEYTLQILEASLPDNYSFSPLNEEIVFNGTGSVEVLDFCLTALIVFNDLKITLLPIIDARPGFDTEYKLVYENIGTTVLSGEITLQFDNARQTYLNSVPNADNVNGNTITWNYSNLLPFQTRTITLNFNTLPPPTNNSGDILAFETIINPLADDQNPEDNTYNFEQIIVNSFDPNDKQVNQGEEIYESEKDNYLDYIVRFQNTGTADAINVRIEDILSDKLNWNTFRPLAASHNYRVEILDGNNVSFIFDSINLPPEVSDPEGSNGFVAFQIKPIQDISLGDVIENTAGIYFDFNAPIITNTVSTTVIEDLSVDEIGLEGRIQLYPNPVGSILQIKTSKAISFEKATIYSTLGKRIIETSEKQINLETLSAGIYFVEVVTDKGSVTKKIVKE